MSNQVTTRVRKIDDATALDFFDKLRDLEDWSAVPTVRGFFTQQQSIQLDVFRSQYNGVGTRVLWRISFSAPLPNNNSVEVTFSRTVNQAGNPVPSPYLDEVQVTYHSQTQDWSPHVALIVKISSLVNALDPGASPDYPAQPDVSDPLRDTLRQITSTHTQMIDRLNLAVSEMATRRRELDEEAAAKQKAREEEYETALRALEEQRNALERQSAKAERRRIAQKIEGLSTEFLKNRSTLSRRSHSFGLFVGMTSVVAGMTASAVSLLSVRALSENVGLAASFRAALLDSQYPDAATAVASLNVGLGVTDWVLIAKSIFSGLFAVAAFTYAVAWFRRYYEEDVTTAKELQRLHSDVARASWVVEAIHEIQDEAMAELPPAWVEAVTRNLFTGRSEHAQMDDASMALRALMGFTAGAKFGPNGAEFEVNRKGAKALSQADE